MGVTYTYDRLKDIAAKAAARDRANLADDDEIAKLSEIPNLAVEMVAHSGRWPHLIKDGVLYSSANVPYMLLPADFEAFERDDQINYAPGQYYGPFSWTDLNIINHHRSRGTIVNPPRHVAMGETIAEAWTLAATASAGAGSLSGTWKYRAIWFDGAGTARISTVAAPGAVVNKAYIELSGWPTTVGTVWLYRTASGGSTLKYLTAIPATTASYQDGVSVIADGSLSALFPDDSDVGTDFIGRRKLELWPTPEAVRYFHCTYRRLVKSMSAAGDAPDLPVALHQAVRLAVGIVARREFEQAVPDGLYGEFTGELARVTPLLMNPAQNNGKALNSVMRDRLSGLPVGLNRDLKSSWATG